MIIRKRAEGIVAVAGRFAAKLGVAMLMMAVLSAPAMALDAPTVSNAGGASHVTSGGARLNGYLIGGDAPVDLWIYWGDNDGSTNNYDWDNFVSIGQLTTGAFNTAVSSLTQSTLYYYRCFASNAIGMTWASNTAQFVTFGAGGTVNVGVGSGLDDVEEGDSGTVQTDSFDLDLVYNPDPGKGNQIVGIRFNNLQIPKDAVIVSAYIQFTARRTESAACSLTIKGEAADNSAQFSASANNVTLRPTTTSSANWIPSPWYSGEAGSVERTPDLSAVVQEIISRGGWSAGSSMAFVFTGTGVRTGWTYEGSSSNAAALHVEWGTLPATAPTVSNGGGASGISSNSAVLNGDMISTGRAPTEAWIYWGAVDGGTDKAAWSNVISAGSLGVGAFSNGISGLAPDSVFYYRCYASNSIGDGWASASASFSTLAGSGNVTNGLLVYWKFDEGGGSTILDSSGLGNNGTAYGVAEQDWESGKFGSCIFFKAGDEYVLNSNLSTAVAGDLTISFWSKFALTQAGRRAVDLAQASNLGYQARIDNVGHIGWDNGGGPAATMYSVETVNDDQWHHIVMVRQGATGNIYRMYVDNRLSVTGSGSVLPYSRLFVGKNAGAAYWYGSIDEVRVYNRALSGGEIGSLYAWAGEGVTVPVVTTSRGASNVSNNTARLTGSILSTGGAPTEAWIYWGDNDGGTNAASWDSVVGIGAVGTGAFSGTVTGLLPSATYYYRCLASNSAGTAWSASTVTFMSGARSDYTIAASSSDAEEWTNGTVSLDSQDIELINNPDVGKGDQTVGLSFTNIQVSQGAIILSAYIQFTARYNETAPCSLTIRGQASDNAATFAATLNNISTRALTGSSVAWSLSAWNANEAGAYERTPDLTAIVQQIVNRNGWLRGNTLAFVIKGTGTRTAWAYDGDPARSAVLHIEWGSVSAASPRISNAAGATGVSSNSATLNGDLTTTGGAPTEVWIYWGASDGGTDKVSWANTISLGITNAGQFARPVASLTPNTVYYYRCYASNSIGDAWASSSSQFAALGGDVESGLVVRWRLDEGSGATIYDSSGLGNNGTAVALGVNSWVGGKFGSAINFDGADDFVFNSNLNSAVSGDMTISCWLSFKGMTGGKTAIDLTDSTNAGLQVSIDALGRVGWTNSGGPATALYSSYSINDDQWHHVAIVRQGTAYSLYVDGKPAGSGIGSVVAYTKLLAGRNMGGGFWLGRLDDVRVYGRALSWGEIGNLNAGVGGMPAGDADGDGMADSWETLYLSSTNAAPGGDQDGDAASNLREYVAGTDPTNGLSVLEAVIFLSNGNVVVSYPGLQAAGTGYEGKTRLYDLETSADIVTGLWQAVIGATNIPGSNVLVNYSETLPQAWQFYRVRAKLR